MIGAETKLERRENTNKVEICLQMFNALQDNNHNEMRTDTDQLSLLLTAVNRCPVNQKIFKIDESHDSHRIN